MSELPKGWVAASLNELMGTKSLFSDGDWIESKDQDPNGENRLLQLADIGDGQFINKSSRFVNDEKFEALNCTELKEGDVLIARMPDPLGRACLMPYLPQRCLTVVDVAMFRTGETGVSNKWLMYLLNSPQVRAEIELNSSGTTRKRIARGKLGEMALPIPPLAEQTRIAQKLDGLLAQVDTLKARIDAIPALLKRFRQSTLTAAVSGRLTEEWRKQNSPLDSAELVDWRQTIFGEICREITVGYVGKMADQYKESGVPFLRSQNVRPLRFAPENILYISEEFHTTIIKSRLEPGDLAIVRSGAPGVTCVIPESLPISNCSDLVIARPSEKLNPWFGCIYMNSEIAQRNVADNQVGVAQQHFNVGSMKKMPINLPPIDEQTEIVRRVEQLFTFAEQLEARVDSAKSRIDLMTQSILAKAFRGKLVPQDPNDEPASVLLERIKAQRAAAPKAKRGRKASA
ncbi:restriction endonuclease subunit S [Pseudomonas fragi]|uniref:restriction endonuclease subunit S n=1 Tax=Pseudomonas fragi TaxID=296 RepID=UPI001CA4557C|nr:restriction endonuclease subunit S [Pseudomonas fragi]